LQEPDKLKLHFDAVTNALLERKLILFLGAGASLCDRGEDVEWDPSQGRILPSSAELTTFLADEFTYPDEPKELTRVSQYAATMRGLGPLYDKLQDIFARDYELTSLHRFLATIPSLLRARDIKPSSNPARQRLIIVTTNYDDLLERAFEEANERYHKLVYMADETGQGEDATHPGNFLHWMPDGELNVIDNANEYGNLEEYMNPEPEERYPAIIKIHGAVDRTASSDPNDTSAPNPSYVITEDHYIDFLTRADISSLLPGPLAAALKRNHFLFLGYSLRDWNLRVILRRIWWEQRLNYTSWAIQLKPDPFDERYWQKRDVEIINMDVADYLRKLGTYLEGRNG
jgi:hypothetical protein